jgi:hypothetical protein
MSRWVAGAFLVWGLPACATVDPTCEQAINDCLKRCQASGGDEVKVEHVTPEQSQTWCENRCQRCRDSTTPPAAPPPSSPPTYTGTAP